MERRRSRTASLPPPPRPLEHSTRGYREVKAPLSLFFFYRMDQDLADCCCCCRCRTRFLRGKQRIVPSRTDGAPSPQYRSSSNQPDSSVTHWIQSLTRLSLFFPPSLHFHPVLFIMCECVNAYANVFQSKYRTSSWEERGRQTNVSEPTGI